MLSVQDLIQKLMEVEDKTDPVFVFLNGERYAIDMVDDSIEGQVDINANGSSDY